MAYLPLTIIMIVDPSGLDRVYTWGPWIFNLILAVVGMLQVRLLTATWKATAKQADLQEFAARQWVEITDWDVSKDEDPSKWEGVLPESKEISISFKILNPSQVPLDLSKVACAVSTSVKQPLWIRYEGAAGSVVPPHSATGRNSYSCSLSLLLQGDDLYRYSKNALGILVSVEISFVEARGKSKVQVFHSMLACGYRHFLAVRDIDERLQRV